MPYNQRHCHGLKEELPKCDETAMNHEQKHDGLAAHSQDALAVHEHDSLEK